MSERTYSLCQYSFVPFPHDEKNPRFALGADVYAHALYDMLKKYKDKNHTLAIWLDIQTQEWIVRKEYKDQTIQIVNLETEAQIVMISDDSTKNFQEVYRGKDFQEALDMCTILSNKYCGSETKWIKCSHNYESYCCKKYKDNYAYRGED